MIRCLPVRTALVAFLLLLLHGAAAAQGLDVTVFVGRAYPTYDELLVLRAPAVPSLPGVEVSSSGTPEIHADGGPVYGAALAFEFGVLAVEGRLDATDIGFDLEGARYEVRASVPEFQGLAGNLTVGNGRFDADRLKLLSLNARLRTPGPVGLVVSGGLSYLPDITISGAVPLQVQLAGLSTIAGVQPRVRLLAVPGESDHRFGVNGGAGIRIGGRVAVMAEARVFYFREYELRFDVEDAPALANQLLEGIAPIRFEPIIVNAQAGLVFRF